MKDYYTTRTITLKAIQNDKIISITFEEGDLDDMLEQYNNFLNALGFHFSGLQVGMINES